LLYKPQGFVADEQKPYLQITYYHKQIIDGKKFTINYTKGNLLAGFFTDGE
jgi:hypothetical protein